MNKYTFFLFSLCIGIGSSLATTVSAAPTIDEAFDPNFLISDEEIQNEDAMTRSDIQAFLEERGGALATLKTADKDGTMRQVSDIIYRAAQEHDINPKYLLVKLQKEQSLITEKTPTQKQLDGATGYGITDGCGWDCDVYKRNKGFGKQVDSAAGIIRWYYDHVSREPWIKKPKHTYLIDETPVFPANYATAFLYTYTPHIEGNKNFWKLWQNWFDQQYPDGTLAKATGESDIYLIQDGKKRRVKNMAVLKTQFGNAPVLTIPASELGRYETASELKFPNFSILNNGSNYYLLDFDTLRPFENKDTVRALGYHPDEIVTVTAADIADYAKSTKSITAQTKNITGRIIQIKGTSSYYYIKDGTFAPIFDKQIAQINFPNQAIEVLGGEVLDGLKKTDPILFQNGTLIGITGDNKIYVIEHGKKRHIASEEVFLGLGYSWDDIVWTDFITGGFHDTGVPLFLRRAAVTPPQTVAGTKEVAEESSLPSSSTLKEGSFLEVPEDQTTYTGTTFETPVNTYIIADADGTILVGKNIDTVRPMASFAKVMTGYQLLRSGVHEYRSTKYIPEKHKAPYHYFRIAPGEMVRNSDLLNAFLVSSLNTPGYMLADSLTTPARFVADINKLAADWGLSDTTFVDMTGEKLGNQTTARNYLTLFSNALENTKLRAYLGRASYSYDETLDLDGKPGHHDTHSNDLMQDATLSFKIIASKTGYLDESGSNLAMLVSRKSDGKQFYIITMGNPDYAGRFDEPKRLAQWALSNF